MVSGLKTAEIDTISGMESLAALHRFVFLLEHLFFLPPKGKKISVE